MNEPKLPPDELPPKQTNFTVKAEGTVGPPPDSTPTPPIHPPKTKEG